MFIFLLLPFLFSASLSTSPLTCSSLPVFDQFATTLYFACTCPQERMEGQFSLASFAYNLSQSIFDRSLVVDFRDCWSLDIIMDQLELNFVQSDYFRPDLQFKEINVENMFQVHLVQPPCRTPSPSTPSDYVNYPTHHLSVHLYSVNNVVVDSEALLDHLTTEWEQTKLHIDLTTQDIHEKDYNFDIAGFKHSNIFFITDEQEVELKQMSEFQDVLHDLKTSVLTRSKQMSLGLGLCVFVLTLGVGAMMLATIKRHQLLIECVVYSSIGSLRRIKDKNYVHEKEKKPTKQSELESHISAKRKIESNNEVTTTTTQVDFFPQYSVVNKSQRGVPRHLKDRKTVETVQSTKCEIVPKNVEEEIKKDSHASSVEKIFSTLKFKANRKPKAVQDKITKPEPDKTSTSFYYQQSSSDSSSKYDLTLSKTTTQVQAQVHQTNYGQNTYISNQTFPKEINLDYENQNLSSSSPEPLMPSEKFYSFRALQEKCRKMISGSKPFQDSTRL